MVAKGLGVLKKQFSCTVIILNVLLGQNNVRLLRAGGELHLSVWPQLSGGLLAPSWERK